MSNWELFAEQTIRSSGLRLTAPRRRVLHCLAEMPRHFGADEISRTLRGDDRTRSVSRATLYRFLVDLERIGLLRKVLLSEGHSHYELASAQEQHYHIVCSVCGRVVEIMSSALRQTITNVCNEHDFNATDAQVEITVTCSRCTKEIPEHCKVTIEPC